MYTREKTIFLHGKIFTSNKQMPYADSMVVENGRILWIGTEKDLPYEKKNAIDLKGRRVIPGFVDAHMHPIMLADFRKKITIMPPEIHSIDEMITAIQKRRQQQQAGEWIEGWGYDEQGFLEKRSPNRYDLDQGCNDSPVSIMRTCAHIRCVNSIALKIAGIDRNTPDPPGGEIERDEKGEPTGILKENARHLITPFLPVDSSEAKISNVLELGELLTSQGITAICDMGNLDYTDNDPIYQAAVERGFHQKVGLYYMWDFFSNNSFFQISKEKFNRHQQIFTAGLKLIGDGSISGKTAWMHRPYLHSLNHYGISVCSDALLESAIDFCKKQHCQLSIHAMGRKAIERMIDRAVLENSWTPASIPYVRIEHGTDPSEESLEKAAAHGISFVSQPIFLYAESSSYLANLGEDWMKQCYPYRHMLEKGILLGFSTDAPATFWAVPSDPFPGLKLAVTRTSANGLDCGKEQALDIETALRLYTRGSAMAAGFPNIGMLAPGYEADFSILNEDILSIDSKNIDKIKVMETYIHGKQVYCR